MDDHPFIPLQWTERSAEDKLALLKPTMPIIQPPHTGISLRAMPIVVSSSWPFFRAQLPQWAPQPWTWVAIRNGELQQKFEKQRKQKSRRPSEPASALVRASSLGRTPSTPPDRCTLGGGALQAKETGAAQRRMGADLLHQNAVSPQECSFRPFTTWGSDPDAHPHRCGSFRNPWSANARRCS